MQFRIPLVVVLVNDGAYGDVSRIQSRRIFGNRLIASDLRNPDFRRFVESFGALALRAETPEALRGALRTALGAGVPAVIEVPAGPMPDPWACRGRGGTAAGAGPPRRKWRLGPPLGLRRKCNMRPKSAPSGRGGGARDRLCCAEVLSSPLRGERGRPIVSLDVV